MLKAVTYGDAVPVLVDHHDAQEHAKRKEKETIDVMFDGVADRDAEGEQDDLSNGEEGGAEYDISDGPAVFEGSEDENELGDDVNDGAN